MKSYYVIYGIEPTGTLILTLCHDVAINSAVAFKSQWQGGNPKKIPPNMISPTKFPFSTDDSSTDVMNHVLREISKLAGKSAMDSIKEVIFVADVNLGSNEGAVSLMVTNNVLQNSFPNTLVSSLLISGSESTIEEAYERLSDGKKPYLSKSKEPVRENTYLCVKAQYFPLPRQLTKELSLSTSSAAHPGFLGADLTLPGDDASVKDLDAQSMSSLSMASPKSAFSPKDTDSLLSPSSASSLSPLSAKSFWSPSGMAVATPSSASAPYALPKADPSAASASASAMANASPSEKIVTPEEDSNQNEKSEGNNCRF